MKPAPTIDEGMQSSPMPSMLNDLFTAMALAHNETRTPYFSLALSDFALSPTLSDDKTVRSSEAAKTFLMLCDPVASSLDFDNDELIYAESIAEVGRTYMKIIGETASMSEIGPDGMRYHPENSLSDSRKAVRAVTGDSSLPLGVKDLAYAQTALYTLYESARQNERHKNRWWGTNNNAIHNHIISQCGKGESHFQHHVGKSSNQSDLDDFFVQRPHKPLHHNKAGSLFKYEIRPWSIAPIYEADGVAHDPFTSHMLKEVAGTKVERTIAYTPFFTTIDFYQTAETKMDFMANAHSIIADSDIIPLVIGRRIILFVHRDFGFFALRAPYIVKKEGEDGYTAIEPVNFREVFVHHMGLSPTPTEVIETPPRKGTFKSYKVGKALKWSATSSGDSTSVLAHEMKKGKHVIPMTNMKPEDLTFATRIKYGLSVGLCSELTVFSGSTRRASQVPNVADAVIPTRNIDKKHHLYYESPTVDSEYNQTKYHAPLRVLYRANTVAPMWSEMATSESPTSVPPPTHKSNFIPSWKDARRPITVNLGGAPPLGYNHRESRCKVCNGRVILTMPRGWPQEKCPCPHCRDGEILIKEVKS